MDEKQRRDNSQNLDIDLRRLFHSLEKKSLLISIVAVVTAVVTFLGTYFLVTPQYQSAATFYVNNSAPLAEASQNISSADISASRGLVASCIVILESRQTLNAVIEYSNAERTVDELQEMIGAESVDSTEIFRVVVTSSDPYEAETIANAVAHILPERISGIMGGSSVKILDVAIVAAEPSSPSYLRNTVSGFAVGLVLTVVWVALQSLLDSTIRSEEDIACCCDFPILAAIPDRMRDCCDKHTGAPDKRSDQVGRTVPFAAVEAYKLLRTKLHFIFADQDGCSVIGVTSSLPGEGKSITSLNLAYSMSCLSKRVLLLECDMRCPSLAEKLSLRKTPGLSEFLCGQIQADKLLQLCGETGNTQAFHFISAGRIPPNPIELLSSRRMQKIMEPLRQRYDYIILDMPSVIETADALAAAKLTDGMLMVVRRDCCDRVAFRSAIGQLSFMNARILGIVFNCASEDNVWRRSLKKHMRQEVRGKEVSGDLRFPQGNRTGNGEYSSSGGE